MLNDLQKHSYKYCPVCASKLIKKEILMVDMTHTNPSYKQTWKICPKCYPDDSFEYNEIKKPIMHW